MEVEQINPGNRIYSADVSRRINDIKKFYENLKEPYRICIINMAIPDRLTEYRIKKMYRDFMENINTNLNDLINTLRKKTFHFSNYINIGNLVDVYAK